MWISIEFSNCRASVNSTFSGCLQTESGSSVQFMCSFQCIGLFTLRHPEVNCYQIWVLLPHHSGLIYISMVFSLLLMYFTLLSLQLYDQMMCLNSEENVFLINIRYSIQASVVHTLSVNPSF